MEKTTWVKCEVTPGQFPQEGCVTIRNCRKRVIATGIFPDTVIKENKLKVVVLGRTGNQLLITAPTANGYGFFGASSFWVNQRLVTRE